jgi:hypothetical protein
VVFLEIGLRILSIAMFYLMANNLDDPKWLRRVSWLLFLPGLATLFSSLHGSSADVKNWNVLLETVLACSLWGWLLEGRKAGPAANRKWTVPAAILLAAVILQTFLLNIHWISGWLAMFAGLFFVTLVRSRPLFFTILVLAALLAAGAQPFLQNQVVHKVQTSGDMDRFAMARGSVLYALHFPLGIGPGNYRAYNEYYGSPAVWNTTPYTSCHDTYGQTLSEMGFGGLAVVLFWVISALAMLARIYTRLPQGFSRSMVLGIAGMWAGLAVAACLGDYFIPVYYNGGLFTLSTTIYGWLALGIAVAHSRSPIVDAPSESPKVRARVLPEARRLYR